MALKYNKFYFSMRQKYGSSWDAPLFSKTTKAGPVSPQSVPFLINDATEEKAQVYNSLLTETTNQEQRNHVLSVTKRLSAATDNHVARVLKIHPSTVAARRNELRDLGLVVPVLDEKGKKVKIRDSITGIPNTLWRAR
jgi:hypothetical protein